MNSEVNQVQRARRMANKAGCRIEKSRTRKHFHVNDRGGWMILDDRNTVIDGVDHDLTISQVVERLQKKIE
jgi:hypothetical protein